MKLVQLALLICFLGHSLAEAQVTVIVRRDKDDPIVSNDPPFAGKRSSVDVALLLDTSNSMDGLISQAKNQLWTIAQEFAKAERHGKTPRLRVALFEYGNSRLSARSGWIRQVVGLTDDLDELSEALFALRTQGGDEYCGQVIDTALERLDWSHARNSYKAIFIAGNEPFTQGPVAYEEVCRAAIEQGIVVNTIHCGDYATGIQGKWKHGAELAEGEYFNIDQDHREIRIECPQDKIILELNAKLNKTYLWFGERAQRERWRMRQDAQDQNAAAEAQSTAVNRVVAKAGRAYNNSSRDLVDGFKSNENLLAELDEEELPAEMQTMDEAQRAAHVEHMSEQRTALQQQIAKLQVERNEFLNKQRQELAGSDAENTLGAVMVTAVRKQLTEAGFEVEQ